MTTPSTARKAGPLLGNGSTTSFPFTFKVFAASDVAVSIADSAGAITVLVLDTDYSVSLNANQDTSPGGTITYPISGAALPTGSKLAIIGDLDYDQPLDLPSGGNFSPLALENQLDRATMQIQQLKELSDRSAKMSVYSSAEDVEALTSGIIVLAEISDDIAAVAANEADISTVAGDIANVNAVGGSIANVNAVAGNATNINAVVANATNINTVAGSIGSVNTVAGNVSLMNTVADNLSLWRDATAADDITVTNFSGTGAQVAFTLPYSPGVENNTQVYISGVYQQKDQYSVSGAVITFSSAPPSGTNNIEVVWSRPFVLGATDSALVSYLPAGTGAVATTVQGKLRESVSVKDFGAVGDGVADDTAAFANAFATGKAVYAPKATYLLNYLQVPSNTYLFGDGASTVIKPFTPDVRCALGADSGSASTYIENITIRDVQFLGDVATQGFSEQKHLTSFNGVRNLLIENCHFVGFRGDGIYLGSGDAGGATERHNLNVAVRGCLFDGVNKDNRNAISIVDGDDVTVEGCHFTRTTRSNMPGAIDVEPNANVFHVNQNIKIVNNTFFDIGGSTGAIAFVIQEQAYTTPPNNFLVSGNTLDTCNFAAIYWQYSITGGITDSYASNSIVVSENVTENTTFPFIFINAKTLTIENNTFKTSSQGARLSTLLANQNIIDVMVQNNLFVNCATASNGGLGILPATRVFVLNNEFNDCGNGTTGGAIQFNSGTSSSVTIAGNNFLTPTGKTTYAIKKEAGHTFTPSTNAFFNNRLNGLSNTFEWLPNEAAVPSITKQGTAWTPTVYGGSFAGTATYSTQTGFYTKIGRTVFFSLECNWTDHTGVGQIYVTLPESTSATEMSSFTVASCFLYGLSVALAAGEQPYSLINKNPANRLQLYTLNAGTLAALAMRTSGSLIISGSYTAAA